MFTKSDPTIANRIIAGGIRVIHVEDTDGKGIQPLEARLRQRGITVNHDRSFRGPAGKPVYPVHMPKTQKLHRSDMEWIITVLGEDPGYEVSIPLESGSAAGSKNGSNDGP